VRPKRLSSPGDISTRVAVAEAADTRASAPWTCRSRSALVLPPGAPAAAAWPCLPRVAEAPCAVVCYRLYGRESCIETAVALSAAGWPQKETS
jgi:hypothetical protein